LADTCQSTEEKNPAKETWRDFFDLLSSGLAGAVFDGRASVSKKRQTSAAEPFLRVFPHYLRDAALA
jgi:hypothetical protein